MFASGRLNLNKNQETDDETGNVENVKDGGFSAIRPNNDRQAHVFHGGI